MSKRYVLKRLVNSFVLVVTVMLMCLLVNEKVYASSASVTITTKTVTQGDEFDIQIVVKGDDKIYGAHFYLQYDAEVIEIVSGHDGGGGGQVELLNYLSSANVGNEITFILKAKAKAPGTTDIKYTILNEEDDGIMDSNTENMSVTAKNGSVKVNPPVIASKNNNLASMTVAAVRADGSSYNVPLAPVFSKDVTKYNISVEEGVTNLVVAAKTEDAKAKIYVQWANLDPGDNTTKIIVTAEDGSKKEYVIYTKVPVPETTTPEPVEPIVTVINGTEYFIENVNDAVVLPEGFEAVDYDYNGKTVVVGKGVVKDLIVMYLTNGTGEAGNLFIYDEVAKTFYPMVNVTMSQKLYTIVKAPADIVLPGGFKDSIVTIDGVEFDGWQSEEIEGVYLVYAMNWNGKSGLYYYDTDEQQMIKYFDVSVEAGVGIDEYNNLIAENESLKADITKLENTENENNTAKEQMYKYIIYIAIAVIVILIGAIIILAVKKKKDVIDDEDNNSASLDSVFADIESKEEAEQAEQSELNVLPEEATEVSEENSESDDITQDVTESEEKIDEVADIEDNNGEVTDTDDNNRKTIEVASVNIVEEQETVGSENETIDSTEETIELGETDLEVEENSEESSFEAELGNFVSAIFDEEVETAEETTEVEESVEAEEAIETEEVTEAEEIIEDTVEAEEVTEAEETIEVEEATETEEATEVEETTEELPEESTVDTTEKISEEIVETSIPTETENKSSEKEENKKKVAKILQDENSSIKEEELDMVIDELFDDLFGE